MKKKELYRSKVKKHSLLGSYYMTTIGVVTTGNKHTT